jgi:catechol-2,3-dioxygenase
MVRVAQLASVSLHTSGLSKQAEFYNDRWGLEPIDEHSGEIFFRAEGSRHHVLSLHEDGKTGLRNLTFTLAPEYGLERAYQELLEAGVDVVQGPTSDPAPGVDGGLTVKDPDGNLVELVTSVAEVNTPYGDRDVKPHDVNHVVLESTDPQRLEDFYKEKLGFRMTETIKGVISFYACNRNHHSLAIARSWDGRTGLNHVAFELKDLDAWLKAIYFAGEKGIKRLSGPGRHGPGNNLFAYYHDEEANVMEYTTEIEQVDPSNPPIYHEAAENFGNLWLTVDGKW